ncbi:MAG: hypothetical protein WAR77_05105 [Saprospiraceae bacterium]
MSSGISSSSRGAGQTGICTWNSLNGLMNPAHLGSLKTINFQFESYNYFLVNGIFETSFNMSLPIKKASGIGFEMAVDGSNELKDLLFLISYGKKLNEKTNLGISAGYIHTQTPESNDLMNITYAVGLQTKLLPNLLVGFVIKNPLPIQSKSLYAYPAVFKFGFNYQVNETFHILVEIQKHGILKQTLHFGFIYTPIYGRAVICGINTSGPMYSFAFQLQLRKRYQMTSAIEYHIPLGMSPSIGLSISLN